jgi:aminopeptidase-like protein
VRTASELGPSAEFTGTTGAGADMYELVRELYPICRSITGDGVRQTLRSLQELIDLEIHEVPTGTPVLDWTIPREWNLRDAYVETADGRRIVDVRASNLHVVGYSVPVRARLSLQELLPHLHSLPEHPDWVPYRTSYYAERWGFCLAHNELKKLPEGEYDVCIDSSLEDGSLTYGEYAIPGDEPAEVLIHTHVCHPSLANDNLSGIALVTYLARALSRGQRRFSYRFVFAPGTIGAITWLSRNESLLARIRHGLVVSNVGDPGGLTYKQSRIGEAEIDRAAAHVLGSWAGDTEVVEFSPYGYDERQYCSPGFNLPVGSLSRSVHGTFPEYHTSADDLSFVRPEFLEDSLSACLAILDVLEGNARYRNMSPKGEPQLGRRGLYGDTGGHDRAEAELALLWVLNLSDGWNSLLDIAERSALPFTVIREAADRLLRADLLAEVA